MLSNKVSEIMTTNLVKAPVTATIAEVMEQMVSEDVGRIMITDDEVPVGIFTEKDVLRRVVNANLDIQKTSIKSVMTSPVHAVREETHIIDAFGRMYGGNYRHMLVRGRHGKIIGIVSMRRILNLAVELGQGLNEARTVGEIAPAGIVSVDEKNTIYETVKIMNERSTGAVIVSGAGQPIGIFTERDLLKRVATKQIDIRSSAVAQVMTKPLVIMPASSLIGDVLAEMHRRDIRNMPVSGASGELLGIMSMPEILQYAQAFNIDEQVRKSWKEVAAILDSEDQYTPG